eukprot:1161085-Pelagomonas_calceolata.AAC.1
MLGMPALAPAKYGEVRAEPYTPQLAPSGFGKVRKGRALLGTRPLAAAKHMARCSPGGPYMAHARWLQLSMARC